MDKAEFERAFSILYFALAAHTGEAGPVIYGGEAYAEDGIGVIHLADNVTMRLSRQQIMAYVGAGVLEQQTLLSELATQARAAVERARVEMKDPI